MTFENLVNNMPIKMSLKYAGGMIELLVPLSSISKCSTFETCRFGAIMHCPGRVDNTCIFIGEDLASDSYEIWKKYRI